MPPSPAEWLAANLVHSIEINAVLCVFNMLPLPPLDGGRVAVGLLPDALASPLARLERYGMLILLLFLFVLPYVGEQTGVNLNILAVADRRADGGADPLCADHRAERMSDPALSAAAPSPRVREKAGERSGARRPSSSCSSSTGMRGRSICCWRLAREQKVDLAKISILALADQYLAFIARQRPLRLEIAADYLVMAAWLAYLKSRLLAAAAAGGRRAERGRARRRAGAPAQVARGDADCRRAG